MREEIFCIRFFSDRFVFVKSGSIIGSDGVNQVFIRQLEAEKPSHRTFTFGCQPFECPVAVFALDVTYPKRGGINEEDTGTFTQTAQLQEKRHFHDCFLLQFHKTAVADRTGKIIPAMYLNILRIKGFQVSELFEMKEDKNGDYLTVGQGEFAVSASFAAVFFEGVSLHCRVKIEAEFVCKAVNFHYICIHKR
jgi:hypothetical protein